MTCCFFGHRDTPSYIANRLRNLLPQLVKEKQVTRFLVGNEGGFDRMVATALSELQKEYPNIQCYIVLAYLPQAKSTPPPLETIYPEGLERVPKRFAIDRRNKWMLKQSDITVGYIRFSTGGAARYFEIAKKNGKEMIQLADEYEKKP